MQTTKNVIYSLIHTLIVISHIYILTSISVLGLIKYFLTSSALQTLVAPNLCLLLRLSRIVRIFNVSFSSNLIRLNALSPYQKSVQIGNAQNLGSGFI